MIIIAIIFGTLLIAVIGYLLYKSNQLQKLQSMTTKEMIDYVTADDGTFISVGIVKDGEVAFCTYGNGGQIIPADSNLYEIGSISKTFAALLVSRGVEDGLIDLNAPISQYLELPSGKYYPPVWRIITHTSGYKSYYFEPEMIGNNLKGRNDFYGITKDKILARVASVTLEDKTYPFNYSNFGIAVIGLVLESVYQKDYVQLLSEYITDELKLPNTSVASGISNLPGVWAWAKEDGYIPAGAIISDIQDMSTYLSLCMTSEEHYVRNVFNDLTDIEMHNAMYDSMGICFNSIGMTWIHDTRHHFYWHNGGTSNYNSYIALSEDGSKGVILLSNLSPYKKINVTVIGTRLMLE